jgi:hypothetical protein
MCKVGLVLGVAVVLAAPALAQRGQRGFGGGGFGQVSGLVLIGNKGVQEELKMTPDQVTKATELRTKSFEQFGTLRDLQGDERTAAMRKMNEENSKAVAAILKPEQTKRLKQIELQQAGTVAFANPEVVAGLKLSDDQKEKIKTISEDSAKDMREIFSGARGAFGDQAAMQEMQKKIAAARKEAVGKISSVLNADQKKAWAEMLGKEFDYKPEPFGGRRGRGN